MKQSWGRLKPAGFGALTREYFRAMWTAYCCQCSSASWEWLWGFSAALGGWGRLQQLWVRPSCDLGGRGRTSWCLSLTGGNSGRSLRTLRVNTITLWPLWHHTDLEHVDFFVLFTGNYFFNVSCDSFVFSLSSGWRLFLLIQFLSVETFK